MRTIYFACYIMLVAGIHCQVEQFRSDYEYFEEAGGWFKLHEIPLKWQTARLRCDYEGAMLASPTNLKLNSAIQQLADKYKTAVYTGIHATVSDGDFNSLDNVPLFEIPIKWMPGNPNNHNNNENCIVYHGEGLVEDVNCNEPYPYICYRNHTKDLVMTECGTTDKEYKMDRRTNKCYKFHSVGRPYSVAAAICSAEGGHLAIINSETEAEVLRNLLAQHPAQTLTVSFGVIIRLGFYNWDEGNYFRTLDGQTLEAAGYTRWAKGQPDSQFSRQKQNCGGMFRDASLDDTLCDDHLAFICEKDPKKLQTGKITPRATGK